MIYKSTLYNEGVVNTRMSLKAPRGMEAPRGMGVLIEGKHCFSYYSTQFCILEPRFRLN